MTFNSWHLVWNLLRSRVTRRYVSISPISIFILLVRSFSSGTYIFDYCSGSVNSLDLVYACEVFLLFLLFKCWFRWLSNVIYWCVAVHGSLMFIQDFYRNLRSLWVYQKSSKTSCTRMTRFWLFYVFIFNDLKRNSTNG